ncbi:MAG: hypothetical protein APR54_02860 [Candidatus Cloacimonas sp. SDB]|nr:MAG: hypothetical protein APR54_02860 [Candidatus Cloacimonas sp. SDB]
MENILITGTYCSLNKGDAALRFGAFHALENVFDEPSFSIVTLYPDIDSKTYIGKKIIPAINSPKNAGIVIIQCLAWKLFTSLLGLENSFAHKFLRSPILQAYLKCDIVVDIGGDTLSEVYGVKSSLFHLLHIYLGKIFDKPVVLYAQSIGPFNRLKYLAKYVLNKTDIITVRGQISYSYLKELGVIHPYICLTADAAYLMPQAEPERIERILSAERITNEGPIVGISVSQLIANRFKSSDEFVELVAKVADMIVEQMKCKVLFIPHVTGPKPELDDRLIHHRIYALVKHQGSVQNLTSDYLPQELKGIIGVCDLFIGARMHACIAALSMGVPTINISYHHKSRDVLADFAQESTTISITDLTDERLIEIITEMWDKREQLRLEILRKVPLVQKKSQMNADIIKRIITENDIKPNF